MLEEILSISEVVVERYKVLSGFKYLTVIQSAASSHFQVHKFWF